MRRLLSARIGRFLVAAVAFFAVAGVTGAAYAYWSSTGVGSATATVGTMQTVTVEAFAGGETPNSRLYPGGTSDVILLVKNPNAFTVAVFATGVNGGNGAITATGGSGCATTGVSFSFTNMGLITQGTSSTPSNTLAANSTTLLHLPNAAAMSLSSDTGCQGASFQIPMILTVHR